MATRPSSPPPEWATSDLLDPVTGAPNKEAPTAEFIISGLNRKEPLYRDNINYQLSEIGKWLLYLDERMTDNGIPQ